jgi:hypothetical protein
MLVSMRQLSLQQWAIAQTEKINKELALRGNAKENKGIESNGGLHLGMSFNQVAVKAVILIGNIRCYLKNL